MNDYRNCHWFTLKSKIIVKSNCHDIETESSRNVSKSNLVSIITLIKLWWKHDEVELTLYLYITVIEWLRNLNGIREIQSSYRHLQPNNHEINITLQCNSITVFAQINAPGAQFSEAMKDIPRPIKSHRFCVLPPFEKSPIKTPLVLCTPPFEKSPIKTPSVSCTPPFEKSPIKPHRFCVLPPLKNHLSKPIGFVYSPLWKITHQNPIGFMYFVQQITSNVPGQWEDMTAALQDLDALGVGVVAHREGTLDRSRPLAGKRVKKILMKKSLKKVLQPEKVLRNCVPRVTYDNLSLASEKLSAIK